MRIVVLADSDSYVKWGAALAATLDDTWERHLVVVESRLTVNDEQLEAALPESGMGTVARADHRALPDRLAVLDPDVVLIAARGPVAMVLTRVVFRCARRPVVVTGMPGISIPVTWKALRWRRQSDLMVVHSRRELREFRELAAARGAAQRVALARLPFTHERPAEGTDLVFAPQAVVPQDRADRLELARYLRDAALADPTRRVVLKLRSLPGERSTHTERDAYPDLLAELGPVPANIVMATGSMSMALDTAEGFVTVSSTALLEALARGIPAITIDSFGISDELINPAFVGSGLFGGRGAVVGRDFRHPAPSWLDDNYFHSTDTEDWTVALAELLAARRSGELETLPNGVGSLRAAWDRKQAFGASDRSLSGLLALLVGFPARAVVRLYRRAAARLSSRRSLSASAG